MFSQLSLSKKTVEEKLSSSLVHGIFIWVGNFYTPIPNDISIIACTIA